MNETAASDYSFEPSVVEQYGYQDMKLYKGVPPCGPINPATCLAAAVVRSSVPFLLEVCCLILLPHPIIRQLTMCDCIQIINLVVVI